MGNRKMMAKVLGTFLLTVSLGATVLAGDVSVSNDAATAAETVTETAEPGASVAEPEVDSPVAETPAEAPEPEASVETPETEAVPETPDEGPAPETPDAGEQSEDPETEVSTEEPAEELTEIETQEPDEEESTAETEEETESDAETDTEIETEEETETEEESEWEAEPEVLELYQIQAFWEGDTLGVGDVVTLKALCPDGAAVEWQICTEQSGEWTKAASGAEYVYELTTDNCTYMYRAVSAE